MGQKRHRRVVRLAVPPAKRPSMARPAAGLLTFVAFVVLSFWLLLSNFVPPTGNRFLDWLREDQYYCLLVPLTVPVTLAASYFTWFTKMLFQRN